MRFTDFNLDPRIIEAIETMHYQECTPIQAEAIPPLLEGRDLIGIAQTGTGKTAAYLLPIIQRLTTGEYPNDAINCIIMAPTRELARQIDQSVEAFSYFLPISSVAVYGGNDAIRYEQELRGLKLGADIVIATPGRLLSHMQLGNFKLDRLSFFVLDEADRMLDMGFIDDIRTIVNHLPQKRQTLLFSATMPAEISLLAEQMLSNPVKVKIAIAQPVETVSQNAYFCNETQKDKLLQCLFKDQAPRRTLIFASSKLKVKQLTQELLRRGIKASQMHSDLEQRQRDAVMREFRNGTAPLLVATDIISRGIDIDDIETVINYNVPRDVEDYIHRIGRTARAGKNGKAITFVSPNEQHAFDRIERFLHKRINRLPLPDSLCAPSDSRRNTSSHPKNPHHHGHGYRTTSDNAAHRSPHQRRPSGERPSK